MIINRRRRSRPGDIYNKQLFDISNKVISLRWMVGINSIEVDKESFKRWRLSGSNVIFRSSHLNSQPHPVTHFTPSLMSTLGGGLHIEISISVAVEFNLWLQSTISTAMKFYWPSSRCLVRLSLSTPLEPRCGCSCCSIDCSRDWTQIGLTVYSVRCCFRCCSGL